ncbi:MAG TPA: tetratricopeptide repeat protein [Candidatus Limnocylindria bacterium]|nr:tetratricopeptide repeat protein [Candidatus Limnocylindria bacterium]
MGSRKAWRLLALGVGALIALSLVACQPTGAPKTSAQLAAEALERGVQAQNSGKTEEALVAYFETLSREPKNKIAFYNLGQIYRLQRKNAIAEGYYRQSLEIDPEYTPALFGFGYTRLSVGAWQEAADANRRVIAKEPNNAAAHFNLALALRALGQEAEAQREFGVAKQLDASLQIPASPTPTLRPSPTGR